MCDGTNLGGNDCITLGFQGGIAICGGDCQFNTTGCTDQVRYFKETFDAPLPPAGWNFSYPWEWGTPSVVGPSVAFSGESCIGTIMAGNSPTSAGYDTAWVVTPAVDLTDAATPVLMFWAWVDIDDYDYDNWHVEVSIDGVTWTLVTNVEPAYTGTAGGSQGWEVMEDSNTWSPFLVHVPEVAGQSSVYFRISSYFDHYSSFAGIYVDDVQVVEGAHVPISIPSESDLGSAVADFSFTRNINVWGGSGAFHYSFVGTHPGWLSLDPDTGVLTGTPAVGDLGVDTFTIRVEDAGNPLNTDQKNFTVAILSALFYEDF